MASLHLGFTLLVVTACADITVGELAIGVTIPNAQPRVGEDVEVHCHVTNEERQRFIINWVKRVGTVETEVGTAHQKINQPFETEGRYSATIQYNKADRDLSDVTFILKIQRVSAMDSGELGCKIDKADLEVFEDLTVLVPFASLSISSKHMDGTHHVTYASGQTVEFDEGERRNFYCRAEGGYPTPAMSITLDDENMESSFNKSVTLVQTGVEGLKELTYDIEMGNPALEITYNYNNKRLECAASIPGTEFANTTFIDVKLNGFKPHFLCDNIKFAALHDEYVNLTCRVVADPPINGSLTNYLWERLSSGNDSVTPGEILGHTEAFLERGKSDHEHVMTLRIGHVYIQHFRTYFFEATNDIGTSSYGIELKQAPKYNTATDPTPASALDSVAGSKDGNSAASVTASIGLLVLGGISHFLA